MIKSLTKQGIKGSFLNSIKSMYQDDSDGKESICSARDLDLIPGWGDPLEKGMAAYSNILAWKYPMNRGAWWATQGHKDLDMTEQLTLTLGSGENVFSCYFFSTLCWKF